jgi:hypothetical protein
MLEVRTDGKVGLESDDIKEDVGPWLPMTPAR